MDLVEAGYVRDISDFSLLGKFDQSIADLYAFDGKNYGVPLGTSFLTTWYNKDMFADAGVTELPQNYDEFVEVCEKLKAKGYTPIVCGDKDAFVIQFGIYQLGASAIYPDNIDFDAQLFTGETKFTDDVWVDTVTKFANLYEKGYVMENTLGISQQQSRQKQRFQNPSAPVSPHALFLFSFSANHLLFAAVDLLFSDSAFCGS